MAAFKPVTHAIFDLDGTIFDTEKVLSNIYETIVSRYGKTITWPIREKCLGSQDTAKILIEELQLPLTVQEFHAACCEAFDNPFTDLALLPGIEKLINHFYEHKIPMAIATSSKKTSYNLKVKNHQELMSKFHHVVCGSTDEEVKCGKPAPDIFLVCNNRFENPPLPEKVLVFEDSPNGVKAAIAAGMQVVMVPDPRMNPDLCKESTLVLSSMEQFKPELFGLPPYPET